MTSRSRVAVYVGLAVLAAGMLSALATYLRPERLAGTGYVPDPEGTRQFLSELERPTFSAAAPEAMERASAAEVDTFGYRTLSRVHQAVYGTPWKAWNQGSHGSCVSFGFAIAAWQSLCHDWEAGRLPMPPPIVATEPIYGGSRTSGRSPPQRRNTGGDGSYGAAAARWVSGKCGDGAGGILFRQVYELDGQTFDLREYSIPRSIEWGREGVPEPLAREARKLRAQAVAQVSTWDQLVAAVRSGYGVAMCSDVGWRERPVMPQVRDAHGFLARSGSWNHCMGVGLGLRFKSNGSPDDGVMVANSWGSSWVSGPRWPEDMPDGCYWARRRDVEEALRQGDSFAVGGVDGFAWRDIDNGGWVEPAPPEPPKPQPEPRDTPPVVISSGTLSLAL
jgi:hypothetical protein